ncbi:MAG: hypothetical protein ACP5D2_00055, partial [Candidatus Nanoarchaeia archaeon]
MKKKCPACGEKVERKFNYCPYCGEAFKQRKQEEDFGMLGRDDFDEVEEEISLPFGLDKMMSSLMKQIEKQFNDMQENQGSYPKGFKIHVSTGKPKLKKSSNQAVKQIKQEVSKKELERRQQLPKEEAKSNIRRLSDRLVYVVDVP